jgi:hypothetical protein
MNLILSVIIGPLTILRFGPNVEVLIPSLSHTNGICKFFFTFLFLYDKLSNGKHLGIIEI